MLPDGSGLDRLPRLAGAALQRADHPAHRAERGCRPHHRARDRRRRLSRQAVQSARADCPRARRAAPPRRIAAAAERGQDLSLRGIHRRSADAARHRSRRRRHRADRRRVRSAQDVSRAAGPRAVARPAARSDARPRGRRARPLDRCAGQPACAASSARAARRICSRRCAMAATSSPPRSRCRTPRREHACAPRSPCCWWSPSSRSWVCSRSCCSICSVRRSACYSLGSGGAAGRDAAAHRRGGQERRTQAGARAGGGPRLCRLYPELARLARGARPQRSPSPSSRDGWRAPLVVSVPVDRPRLALLPDHRSAAARRALERAAPMAAADHPRRHGDRRVRGEPHGRPLALLENAVEQVGPDGALCRCCPSGARPR